MKKTSYLIICAALLLAGCAKEQIYNPFGHALVPDMIADASIADFNGTFYCYATTDGYGQGLATSGPPTLWISEDFEHWRFSGTYFPEVATRKFWAPSKAVERNGKYFLYPTVDGQMYAAVSESPEGPFRMAKEGLLVPQDPGGIDAEVFVDDNGQAYLFWSRNHVAKLASDMITVDTTMQVIETPRHVYSEGPAFFKRNGIYYYLYTVGGDEKYQYAYMTSRESPMGPFSVPEQDIITTTDYANGVLGPGHGCVLNPEGTDDYYFVYLEFGRRSTNRQTYVNKMEFDEEGNILPVKLDLNGVGTLRGKKAKKPYRIKAVTASSIHDSLWIKPIKDTTVSRTEQFFPEYAIDGQNGSRWMASEADSGAWICADLGYPRTIHTSKAYFVRPTAGHAYCLEGSLDGKEWIRCGGHDDVQCLSPHVDKVERRFRYLRITITNGINGLWEWEIR
ncbi:MAG: family 43 glycosylhydrolase [Bacteroidaceae bacterium]|nr:family 43 glycosylhydrolase [Bacteroidaceae bacterium]